MDNLAAQLDQFIHHCRYERALSEHTCTAYRRDINKFLAYLSSLNHPDHVAFFTIQQWLSKAHEKGIGAKSLARYLASLRSFFHYLKQHHLIEDDPTIGVKTPKVGKSLPKTLDADQIQAALAIPQTDALAVRDLAIMELLYSSGLRISELVECDLNQISLAEGLIRVMGKGQKERIVPVGKVAVSQIKQWLAVRANWTDNAQQAVFISQSGARLSARSVQKRLKEWAIKLGLDTHLHPHKFRHSVASHLLESSGDLRAVQEFLGHSNLSTTQIYTQLDFQHLAKTYDQTHPRARKKNNTHK